MKGKDAGWHETERDRERGGERGREGMKEAAGGGRRGGGVRLKSYKRKCKQQKERWTTEDRLGEAYQTEVD